MDKSWDRRIMVGYTTLDVSYDIDLDRPKRYRLVGSIEVQGSIWREMRMVKINGKEVEWERHPNHINNVYRHVLWKNEQTGAMLVIIRIEEGELIDQSPHSHSHANQFTFQLSGRTQRPDGVESSFNEGDYGFRYYPKNEKHAGIKIKGAKVIEERINLEYFDGPDDWDVSDKD